MDVDEKSPGPTTAPKLALANVSLSYDDGSMTIEIDVRNVVRGVARDIVDSAIMALGVAVRR
jgi:hypothetical protein